MFPAVMQGSPQNLSLISFLVAFRWQQSALHSVIITDHILKNVICLITPSATVGDVEFLILKYMGT